METNLKKYLIAINFLFFILIVFLFLIQDLINLSSSNKYIICFFLIATIGVSHGAYDGHKAEKFFFKKIKYSKLLFYLTYISLALFVVYSWYLNPKISLIIFLIVSSFHFGKEDLEIYITRVFKFRSVIFFLKGSLIILLPLYFKFNETNEIFNKLFFTKEFTLISNNLAHVMLPINLLVQFLLYLYIFFKKKIFYKDLLVIFFEIALTIIIFIFFSTIVAFTLYFCFIHSLKNILVIASELNSNIYTGINTFILRALPITTITFFTLLASLYIFSNFDILENALQKIIFIGLASLTLPHIILHYFLET
jgi:Brp/Blh family beta-carotene 15,15'-monooxygenase